MYSIALQEKVPGIQFIIIQKQKGHRAGQEDTSEPEKISSLFIFAQVPGQ
jgi:hypothetical protein